MGLVYWLKWEHRTEWNTICHRWVVIWFKAILRQVFLHVCPLSTCLVIFVRPHTYCPFWAMFYHTYARTHTQDFPSYAQWLDHLRSNVCVSTEKKRINKQMKQKKGKKWNCFFISDRLSAWFTMLHGCSSLLLLSWEGSRSWPWRWNPWKSPQHHSNKKHPLKMSSWPSIPSLSLRHRNMKKCVVNRQFRIGSSVLY